MSRQTAMSIALLAGACAASPVWAQTQWNRKIGAVAITPTSGSPLAGSFFDVFVDWSIVGEGGSPSSVPLDMSTEVLVMRNGTLIDLRLVTVSLDPLAGGDCTDCQTTNCGDLNCGTAGNGLADLQCVKDDFCFGPGSVLDCRCTCPKPCLADPTCVPDLPLATAVPMVAGDEIMVILRPAPGALPDGDPSDDIRITTFGGDPVVWNRRIESVGLSPTPGGPPNSFDVVIDWRSATHGIDYPVDLSVEVELSIGGVVVASVVDERLHAPVTCSQGDPPPTGTCSPLSSCGSWSDGGGIAAFPLECRADCLDCSLGGCSYPCWCQCEAGPTSAESGGGAGPLLIASIIVDPPPPPLVVILRPVPGALPELPGLGGDDEESVERCAVAADCCDQDGSGAPDNVCTWCACRDNVCVYAEKSVPSDMGAPLGGCALDGFCNLADALHALTCFAGDNACDIINIDVGGPLGACAPDGFCNLADALHALTCFAGTNPCTCFPVMAQAPEPTVAGNVTLTMTPDRRSVSPGDEVSVRVFIAPKNADRERGIDIRAYQLHTEVSGGRAGSLELIDIEIESRADAVFDEMSDTFDAVSIAKAQVINGLFSDDTLAAPEGYLATFTYAVSSNATGVFVIDVLYDDANQDQTFLVGREQTDKIEIDETLPAVITVTNVRSKRIR